MESKRKRLLSMTLIVIVVIVIIAYRAAASYRERDYLSYFVDLKGQVVTSGETVVEEAPDHRLHQVYIRDDNGLEVNGYLKVPSFREGPLPALIALGGVRTGKRVLDYLGETPDVIVLALDYPYKGKKSGLGVWEFVSKVPDIRQALFNTVPASMLAVDYLLQRKDVDPQRIVFVGGSVGAMFGPVVGAADKRIAAVALLFGAGDLQSVLRANIDAPAPVAAVGAWLSSLLISPLEPLKYVGRLSPRPLFMLNGTGDPRMPIGSSRRLHDSAGEPKTIRWIDAGHVNIRSQEFHGLVKDELVAWLLANDLLPTTGIGDPETDIGH
jgi:predicted esterase